jgi:hypothetical protein
MYSLKNTSSKKEKVGTPNNQDTSFIVTTEEKHDTTNCTKFLTKFHKAFI